MHNASPARRVYCYRRNFLDIQTVAHEIFKIALVINIYPAGGDVDIPRGKKPFCNIGRKLADGLLAVGAYRSELIGIFWNGEKCFFQRFKLGRAAVSLNSKPIICRRRSGGVQLCRKAKRLYRLDFSSRRQLIYVK